MSSIPAIPERYLALSHDLYALFSAQGIVIDARGAWERVLGRAPDSVRGCVVADLVASTDSARLLSAFAELQRMGAEGIEVRTQCRHADGSHCTIAWRLAPFGTQGSVVAAGRDVFDRELEEQHRQSQRIDTMGKLAGGIAHDFNNLVTIIKGHCECLLEDMRECEPWRDDIVEVSKAADRAAELTRQLLAFSRKQILNPQPLELNALVQDLGRMLTRLIGEDIETVTTLGPDAGIVLADAGQLEQVIVNLAVNARDAMPHGGRLTIETRRVELHGARLPGLLRPLSGSFLQLVVRDTGEGMTADIQSRVFEPFFTTKEPGRGTGLGLSTVYGIVKQSNGHVWCESTPGRGTSFVICLPRVDVAPVEARVTAVLPDVSGSETVLLVEDEDAVRSLVMRILTTRGYHVLAAANGEEALAVAKDYERPIHLLLTDAVMPKMGGAELANVMRACRPELRILIMSGYTDDEMLRRGFGENELSLIQKPFAADELAHHVRRMLNSAVPQP